MKIIAITPTGFMVETDKEELANLMGYESDWRRRDRGNDRELRIGDKVPVAKMYDRLYRMGNMGKELTEIAAKLKAASDFVDTALPTIQRVNKKGEGEEPTA